MEQYSLWVEVAIKFGLPTGLLFLFGSAVWVAGSRICKALMSEVVVPLRDRTVAFFDTHTAWMQSMQTKIDKMSEDNANHFARADERWAELMRHRDG